MRTACCLFKKKTHTKKGRLLARGWFCGMEYFNATFLLCFMLPSLSVLHKISINFFFLLLLLLNIVGVVIKAPLLKSRYLNLLPTAMSLLFYFTPLSLSLSLVVHPHAFPPFFPIFSHSPQICIFSSLYFMSQGMATGGKQGNKQMFCYIY